MSRKMTTEMTNSTCTSASSRPPMYLASGARCQARRARCGSRLPRSALASRAWRGGLMVDIDVPEDCRSVEEIDSVNGVPHCYVLVRISDVDNRKLLPEVCFKCRGSLRLGLGRDC